ncbi:MAG: MFS transporter [Burkholderiales bacterium]|nr:MFS transporter [Burkholderiales bacterium]
MLKIRSKDAKHDTEVIALVSLAHASSHFYHLVIPSLFPWLMPAFGLDYIDAGLPVTAFFIVSAFCQSASGFLVEKYGAKVVLYGGLTSLALSSFVLGSAQSYAWIVAAGILAGIGNSVFHPTDFCLISASVSKNWLGHAFAWHGITGNLGWAICPLFMVSIASTLGWRTAAYAASSVALLILALELWGRNLFRPLDVSEPPTANPTKKNTAFGFLTEETVWLCFMFFFFTSFGFGVLQSFSPTIFGKIYGLSLAQASSALTSYMIGSGIGGILGGFIVSQDRLSRDKVVAWALTFSAVNAALLASQIPASFFVSPIMFLMGFGVGVANPSRDVLIRESTISKLGNKYLGRVYGFVYCGMDVGQSLSPIVFGAILDRGLFATALAGVAVCQTCAIFTALRVGGSSKEPQPASHSSEKA